MLVDLPENADHKVARARLEEAGWTLLSCGDWSFVYASPCGEWVARVCPFDPAYALHAQNCLTHAGRVYFQDVESCVTLPPAGDIVFMERLEEAPEDAASDLCCLLGEFGHLEREVDEEEERSWAERRAADAELVATHRILIDTASLGREKLGFFHGLDVRPGNVMQTKAGQLKLIDPYFVAGKDIIDAMLTDIQAARSRYSAIQLRAFLQIACFEDERYTPGPILQKLRTLVDGLA